MANQISILIPSLSIFCHFCPVVLIYYPSGKVKGKSHWKSGVQDGETCFFYNNARLQAKYFYKNGLANGMVEEYYQNGKLKERGKYNSGKAEGIFNLYDKLGNLSQEIEYIIINGKSVINQYKNFNKSNEVLISKSNFFAIEPQKDTLKMGEKYNFKLILVAPYFKQNISVVIGDFDDNYFLQDSAKVDTIIGNKNFVVSYPIKPQYKGAVRIIGYINDYGESKKDDSTIVKGNRKLYFKKNYYVE